MGINHRVTMDDYRYVAPFYDSMARTAFGSTLADAKAYYVNRIPRGSRVLLLGGGTGDALNAVTDVGGTSVDFIEPCGAMIRRARSKVPASCIHRIRFIRSDHQALTRKARYDAVITSFLLDGFDRAGATAVMHRVHDSLKPGGLWLFADFFETQRLSHRMLTRLMYRFFRITAGISASQIPDYDRLFAEAGLVLSAEKPFLGGWVRARVYNRPASCQTRDERQPGSLPMMR